MRFLSNPRSGAMVCAAAINVVAGDAAAQAFPSKTVRFLVDAPPGGSNDIFARATAQRISPALGQPVIVDNRPGANQLIAADLLLASHNLGRNARVFH